MTPFKRFLYLLFIVQVSVSTKSFTQLLPNGNVIVKPELKKHFEPCQAEGVIVIYDSNKQQWILSDSTDAKKETLPASTFKIINLLIALETKVIRDENEIISWPGSTDTVKYGYRPDIYRNMSVKEAFAVSAGWVFVELAKRIGKERYEHYLRRSRYGNSDLSN